MFFRLLRAKPCGALLSGVSPSKVPEIPLFPGIFRGIGRDGNGLLNLRGETFEKI
jgi:hypothetical protein